MVISNISKLKKKKKKKGHTNYANIFFSKKEKRKKKTEKRKYLIKIKKKCTFVETYIYLSQKTKVACYIILLYSCNIYIYIRNEE